LFQHHQIVAVFMVTLEISHINRMEGEGNFCDIAPMYIIERNMS
jgi:hypothetical protein